MSGGDELDAEAENARGTAHAKAGEDDLALAAYRRSADKDPRSHKPHANIATILQRRGDLPGARQSLEEALRLAPDNVRLALRLAKAAEAVGDRAGSRAAYDVAFRLEPSTAHRNLLARALVEERDFARALALTADADDEDGLTISFLAALDAAEDDAAEAAGARIRGINPSSARLQALADAARGSGRYALAEALARAVLREDPSNQEATTAVALCLAGQGRFAEAADLLETFGLAKLGPTALSTWLAMLRHVGHPAQLARLERGLLDRPEDPSLLVSLSMADASDDDATAMDLALRAVAASPSYAVAYNQLGSLWANRGFTERARAYLTLGEELDTSGGPPSMSWFVGLHGTDLPASELAERSRAVMIREDLVPQIARPLDRDPARKLRVGYVSGDLRTHAVEKFARPLFTSYDRARFEVFAYRTSAASDEATERIARQVTMRSLAGAGREVAARTIADDRIDVLVDLAGHTMHTGLPYFAARPAPVQLSFLGYPATTGLGAVDARLSDAHADPPGLTDSLHVEELFRIEPCAWTFVEPSAEPSARPPGAPVVFGSFNRAMKLSDDVLESWAKILLGVPGSRLYIKGRSFWNEATRARIMGLMAKHGLGPERVLIVGWTATYETHQLTWHNVDIALDAFPYAGTTTTCEALSMGVPVVTRAGPSHVSRVGASLLAQVGLDDLVAPNEAEYVARAIALAADEPRRVLLRRELPTRFSTTIGDPRAFVASMERAYVTLFERFLRSPEAELYGRVTRVERKPPTFTVDLSSADGARDARRAAWFDPALRAARAFARPGEPIATDQPTRVTDLQAVADPDVDPRPVELVGALDELAVAALRASLPGAELRSVASPASAWVLGSRALIEARADDPWLLATPSANDVARSAWHGRVLPELDLCEEVDASFVGARVVLGRDREAAMRARGLVCDPLDRAPRVEDLATRASEELRARELSHLAWFSREPLPCPRSVERYLAALALTAVGDPGRGALALAALEDAAREDAADPTPFRALTLARIALGTGRIERAAEALRAAFERAHAPEPPKQGFLPAHPRYRLACLPEGATPYLAASDREPAMTCFAPDPLWPERLAAQAARAEVDPALAVEPVSRWIVQQASECLLLFCEPTPPERTRLLTAFRLHGGRSLAVARVGAAHRLSPR